MKKFKAILLVICVLVYGFFVIKANFISVQAGTSESDHTPTIWDDDPSWNLRHSLTEEQKEKFKACGYISEGEIEFRSLEIAVALGKTDGRFQRMSLAEVKKIIELNKENGPEAIFKAIVERQPYPDVDWWGGRACYIYALDTEEPAAIQINVRGLSIIYVTDDGINEELYSPNKACVPTTSDVNSEIASAN